VNVFLLYKKRALNNKKINKIWITRGKFEFFLGQQASGIFHEVLVQGVSFFRQEKGENCSQAAYQKAVAPPGSAL
jgi:hypothetical protein